MTWQPSAPARRYDYVTDGPAIYVDSFATIRREADLSSVPASAERLAVRMVHGSGQVDLVPDLVIHPEAVPAAREALAATPQQLQVLADAGVVDAGGRGFSVVLAAAETALTGRVPPQVRTRLGSHQIPVPVLPAGTTGAGADPEQTGGDLSEETFGLEELGEAAPDQPDGVRVGDYATASDGSGLLVDVPWWRTLVAAGVAVVVLALLLLRARRRLGGVTGDVLGAGVELTLAAVLVVLS
ncbi:precorrin-8X methylmutase [uncultured Aeromicrobium sp.]|uniref:precorrin-8X methylmutase n=1 Tax=uncultured Aeromicrobium sp. TaxID=337820 RepID=UPI002594486E|nr:precorrin-8X methylmutase [uncultured Aeromicrobium sp.]